MESIVQFRRNLPAPLLDRPEFALLFALVYPQRLTSDLVLFLDDSLRLSFGGSSQS